MENGQAYLIHCGDWHTFVGRVVRMVSPTVYEMQSVSKISETNNGDNWEELAAGDKNARSNANYKHYSGKVYIPLTIAAFEWVGLTPQETLSST